MYLIKMNGELLDSLHDATRAMARLESEAQRLGPDCAEPFTLTIEDESGHVRHALTNRRITGTFTKQAWGGRKGDDAIALEEEDFDATDYVIMLDHADFVRIKDGDESSDSIGLAHVKWDGPCHVSIEESIKDFFGVERIEEISADLLATVRDLARPKGFVTRTEELAIRLEIRIDIQIDPGASWESFVEELDYSFISRSSGIVVTGTEISEASILE